MTDEDMQLEQLNNNTTYYDREGKDTEQDVMRRSRLPVLVTIVEYHSEKYHAFSGSPLDAVSICLVIILLCFVMMNCLVLDHTSHTGSPLYKSW